MSANESPKPHEILASLLEAARAQNPGLVEHVLELRRGAVPFCHSMTLPAQPRQRAEGEQESQDDPGKMILVGTASSTSVDWYGTEMTLRALEGMREQFASEAGVPILPGHGGFFESLEWDAELGRSFEAVIESADVEAPALLTEQGYVLRVSMALDDGFDKARDLMRRLDRGQPIGLSIGGWFTEIRVIYETDDEGKVREDDYGWPIIDRVLVEAVELDHLATVRNPANPDSNDLATLAPRMRSVLADFRDRDAAFKPGISPTEAPSTRNRTSVTSAGSSGASVDTKVETGETSTREALDEVERAQEDPMPDDKAEAQTEETTQSNPVLDAIQALSTQLGTVGDQLSGLSERVSAIEARADGAVTPIESEEILVTRTQDVVDADAIADEVLRKIRAEQTTTDKPEVSERERKLAEREAEAEAKLAAVADLVNGMANVSGRGVGRGMPAVLVTSDDVQRAMEARVKNARSKFPVCATLVMRNIGMVSTSPVEIRDVQQAADYRRDAPKVLRALLLAANREKVPGFFPRDEWIADL